VGGTDVPLSKVRDGINGWSLAFLCSFSFFLSLFSCPEIFELRPKLGFLGIGTSY
jgi:hypothetical protein